MTSIMLILYLVLINKEKNTNLSMCYKDYLVSLREAGQTSIDRYEECQDEIRDVYVIYNDHKTKP